MSTCQTNNVSRKVNVFNPYIRYFCLILCQFFLTRTNFVHFQIETKFNFYIKIHIFMKYFY